MKRYVFGAVLFTAAAFAAAQSSYPYPFQNPNLPAEQRITDLLSRMTVEEKIYCFGIDPSVPRLGVKGSGHIEGLSGVALGGPGGWAGPSKPVKTTQFPEPKGMGQSWDPALLQQAAAAEAYEARFAAQSPEYAGLRVWRIVGGLVVRAPNADLARDPRWGRGGESYGEDPYLVTEMSSAFVRGLQGDDPHYWMTASLMKHFLANERENSRMSSSSDFDERLFWEYYSRSFRIGITQAGAESIMPSYNEWNGVPMTINPAIKNIVEGQWGLNGIVCTDRASLTNLVTKYHLFPSLDQAAAATIHAGINQYLYANQKIDPVGDAIKNHLITEKDLDENLRGVFRVMIKLGQLDPESMVPYARIGRSGESEAPWDSKKNKDINRKITDESIVLLKNENHMLPLQAGKVKSIAVIGPYADKVQLAFYTGASAYAVSPVEGITMRAGPGVTVQHETNEKPGDVVAIAKSSDVVVLVLGNSATCNAQPGKGSGVCLPGEGVEGRDRKSIDLDYEDLVKKVYAANPHTILVVDTSFPFAINWEQEHLPAILEMAHSSNEEGNALADVLFGDYDPSGHLTQTWPSSLEQIPDITDYNIRDGETYMYFKHKPLYAFGYGLSYTTFAYSNIKFDSGEVKTGKPVNVTVEVKNTGTVAGADVVQMYVSFVKSAVSRPNEELAGFERVMLAPGESKKVTIALKPEDLQYWDTSSKHFVLEKGKVDVKVGDSSDAIRLQKTISVVP
jgi:beta-glucosidase